MSEFNMSAWVGDNGGNQSRYDYPLLKIQEGVTYQIRILDAVPVKRYVHFHSVTNRTAICPGSTCLFCMMGNDPAVSQAFINVIDRMDGNVKVLRFAIGQGLGAKLAQLFSSEGDPLLYDIRIIKTIVKNKKGEERAGYTLARVDGEAAPSETALRSRYDMETLLKPMSRTEMEKIIGVTQRPATSAPVASPVNTGRKITTFEDVKSELTNSGAQSMVLNPNPGEDLPL